MATKKNYFIFSTITFLIFSTIIFFSCVSTQVDGKQNKTTKIKNKNYSTFEEEPFYIQNSNLFVQKKLSNGINLVIKKSTNQKNCALTLVIDRDKNFQTLDKSGIEEITFDVMMCGTKKYSQLYISSLEYTDSTKIKTKVNSDFLEYSFTSQKEKLDFIIPIFAQILKAPKLDKQDFEQRYSEKKQLLKDEKQEIKLLQNVYNVLNKYDEYFVAPFVLEQTNISYNDVVNCHKSFLNAKKIKIFASGNFSDKDADDLYNLLNENFGKLQSFFYEPKVAKKQIFNVDEFYNKNFNFVKNKKLRNLILIYNIPLYATQEYLSYGILSLYLDDCFFDLIKQKNNDVLDAGCAIILGKPNLGIISVYNIGEKNNNSILESINHVNLEILKKKIENYKTIYTSFIMSSELIAEKTVRQMILSDYYANDALEYIKFPFYINSLTFENIQQVFDKTLSSGMLLFEE